MAQVIDLDKVKADFAKRLRAARKKAGMTQQDLAVEVGVALRTVGLWEGGFQLPEGKYAVAIEILLGVPLVRPRKAAGPRNPRTARKLTHAAQGLLGAPYDLLQTASG